MNARYACRYAASLDRIAGLLGCGCGVVGGELLIQALQRLKARVRDLVARELRQPRIADAGGNGDARPVTPLGVEEAS